MPEILKKARPILFTRPMVQAILDGRKTQTRRIINKNIYLSDTSPPHYSDTKAGDIFICPDMLPTSEKVNNIICECESIGTYHCMGQVEFVKKHCPYGVPGDLLYVRENIYYNPESMNFYYSADSKGVGKENYDFLMANTRKGIKTIPSIHMFKKVARIWLEIKSVRVERVQTISRSDAKAEGFHPSIYNGLERSYGRIFGNAEKAFQHTWDIINAKRGYSWKSNPWVWAITFKQVETSNARKQEGLMG